MTEYRYPAPNIIKYLLNTGWFVKSVHGYVVSFEKESTCIELHARMAFWKSENNGLIDTICKVNKCDKSDFWKAIHTTEINTCKEYEQEIKKMFESFCSFDFEYIYDECKKILDEDYENEDMLNELLG